MYVQSTVCDTISFGGYKVSASSWVADSGLILGPLIGQNIPATVSDLKTTRTKF